MDANLAEREGHKGITQVFFLDLGNDHKLAAAVEGKAGIRFPLGDFYVGSAVPKR